MNIASRRPSGENCGTAQFEEAALRELIFPLASIQAIGEDWLKPSPGK
jgi:hypothetical protein